MRVSKFMYNLKSKAKLKPSFHTQLGSLKCVPLRYCQNCAKRIIVSISSSSSRFHMLFPPMKVPFTTIKLYYFYKINVSFLLFPFNYIWLKNTFSLRPELSFFGKFLGLRGPEDKYNIGRVMGLTINNVPDPVGPSLF